MDIAARLSTIVDRLREMRVALAVLWEYLSQPAQRGLPAPKRVVRLTRREREVARLIAQGMTNEQIANALTVEYDTVRSHRASCFKKLGVHSVAELLQHKAEFVE